MSVVWMLSLSAIGMPCSGPRTRPRAPLAIERVGLGQRPRIDGDHRVQPALRSGRCGRATAGRSARDVIASLRHRVAHVGDAGLDDRERRRRRWRTARLRRQQRPAAPSDRGDGRGDAHAAIITASVARDTVIGHGSAHGARHGRVRRHRRSVRGGVRVQGLRPRAHRPARGQAATPWPPACANGTARRVDVIVRRSRRARSRGASVRRAATRAASSWTRWSTTPATACRASTSTCRGRRRTPCCR